MLYLVEFSGESREAVSAELNAIREVDARTRILWINSRGAIIDSDLERLSEMAFARRISEIISSSDNVDGFQGTLLPEGKFYLRKVKLGTPHIDYTESEIAGVLSAQGRVSFANPDFVLIAAFADRWYLSIVRHIRNNKEMESRRSPMRPFFSPISLHPKFAKFMVNLSRTVKGDTILDPFCGTGGILIEAGLSGRKVIGNDASLVMVKGARLNLKYFSIQGKIYNSKIQDLRIDDRVNAIVSDLPYGRSSPVIGDLESLYEASFIKFHEILSKGQYCVIIVGDPRLLSFANGFNIVDTVRIKVHNSLTRSYVVLRRN
ncbi:MAG: methyltransferase [Candidatus Thermoplasmatota archaeon]|nr:methyltransferase [Candidatus Thermoplasmatota archaeon]